MSTSIWEHEGNVENMSCGQFSRVLHFSVRNGTVEISLPFGKFTSFQSTPISEKQLRKIQLQTISATSFSWFTDFGKILYHSSTFISTSSFWQMVNTQSFITIPLKIVERIANVRYISLFELRKRWAVNITKLHGFLKFCWQTQSSSWWLDDSQPPGAPAVAGF